ncbi:MULTISPECIES: hypothetical protein [Micrococcaceae]|uniref:hypothetical protein n=1 Tax=unclassified Kocuria TaxID=2649579 RepID=UPI0010138565|nr:MULTISPECIES: hypothetical protein [unclassified Kocuria]
MRFFPSRNNRRPEWQLSLSPEEKKKRQAQTREHKRGGTVRQGSRNRAGRAAPGSAVAAGRSRGTNHPTDTHRHDDSDNRPARKAGGFLRDSTIAFVWGFADATVWCVSPEVWTSNVALKNPARGGAITWGALAGSLAGGVCTYRIAQEAGKRENAQRLLRIPGVSAETLHHANAEVKKYGARALASGAVEDLPYKVHASALGIQQAPMGEFLFWSAASRMTRIGIVTNGVAVLGSISHSIAPRLTKAVGPLALNAGWAAYYAWRLSKGTETKSRS